MSRLFRCRRWLLPPTRWPLHASSSMLPVLLAAAILFRSTCRRCRSSRSPATPPNGTSQLAAHAGRCSTPPAEQPEARRHRLHPLRPALGICARAPSPGTASAAASAGRAASSPALAAAARNGPRRVADSRHRAPRHRAADFRDPTVATHRRRSATCCSASPIRRPWCSTSRLGGLRPQPRGGVRSTSARQRLAHLPARSPCPWPVARRSWRASLLVCFTISLRRVRASPSSSPATEATLPDVHLQPAALSPNKLPGVLALGTPAACRSPSSLVAIAEVAAPPRRTPTFEEPAMPEAPMP
jgi:hypothetical protein